MNDTATRLRRIKGLLIIAAHRARSNQPELAVDTLALALESLAPLSPEDIDTGMMLDSDLGDLMPQPPETSEIAEPAATETFHAMMARLTSRAAV